MKRLLVVVLLSLLSVSCSINKVAVRKVSSAIAGAGSSTVFTGEEDPELVASALPFALKMQEALLEQDPQNAELLLSSGMGFVSYANAFVQGPADMLEQDEYEEKHEAYIRAKRLYLRGQSYALRAMDVRHPGFSARLMASDFEAAFKGLRPEDVSPLYYIAAGTLGAFSCDTMNFELSLSIPKAFACAVKALELDADWNWGAIHDLFISLYGALPEAMLFRVSEDEALKDPIRQYLDKYYAAAGISPGDAAAKGQYHFERAVEAAGNTNLSPYISYAKSYCIAAQDKDGFESLLNSALKIDYERIPENRLANTLNAQKARWLLDHVDDFFLRYEE